MNLTSKTGRPYTNPIVRKSKVKDPDRTPAMQEAEKTLVQGYMGVLHEVGLLHPGDNDDWIKPFLQEIQSRLDSAIKSAHVYLSTSSNPLASEVHSHRRVVAIYHEAIDLYSQGWDAELHAVREGAMVCMGRGYVCLEFSRNTTDDRRFALQSE